MIKTVEQMAEEYATATEQEFSLEEEAGAYKGFLAGYNAGYSAGFEGAMKIQEAVTEHLEKQMIEEMYVRMEPLLKEDK